MGTLLSRPLPYQPTAHTCVTASSRSIVEPVIQMMRTHLDQPLSLNELAEVASLSMYHFHRVFRSVTGIPPNAFLTALRLEEAKRLLLTTSLSVTDICLEVGYAGLGTFTARFTHLVGTSPGRLRQFANTATLPALDRLGELSPPTGGAALPGWSIAGEVQAPVAVPGPIFVGLFPTPIPQARPIAGTVLAAPGRFQLAAPPDGRYYLLAAALPWAEDPRVPSLPGPGLLVGAGAEPLLVGQGSTGHKANLALRPPRPADPPVLSCLPLLVSEQCPRLRSLTDFGAVS